MLIWNQNWIFYHLWTNLSLKHYGLYGGISYIPISIFYILIYYYHNIWSIVNLKGEKPRILIRFSANSTIGYGQHRLKVILWHHISHYDILCYNIMTLWHDMLWYNDNLASNLTIMSTQEAAVTHPKSASLVCGRINIY